MAKKETVDTEAPVREKLIEQLGKARSIIAKVKEPSKALQNLDKKLETNIQKLKDIGNDDDC